MDFGSMMQGFPGGLQSGLNGMQQWGYNQQMNPLLIQQMQQANQQSGQMNPLLLQHQQLMNQQMGQNNQQSAQQFQQYLNMMRAMYNYGQMGQGGQGGVYGNPTNGIPGSNTYGVPGATPYGTMPQGMNGMGGMAGMPGGQPPMQAPMQQPAQPQQSSMLDPAYQIDDQLRGQLQQMGLPVGPSLRDLTKGLPGAPSSNQSTGGAQAPAPYGTQQPGMGQQGMQSQYGQFDPRLWWQAQDYNQGSAAGIGNAAAGQYLPQGGDANLLGQYFGLIR